MNILKSGGYVWGDRRKVHKQGKVVTDLIVVPIDEHYSPMVRIAPVHVDRPVDPAYPEFWVDLRDCVVPSTHPETLPAVTEEQVLEAFRTILRYLRS